MPVLEVLNCRSTDPKLNGAEQPVCDPSTVHKLEQLTWLTSFASALTVLKVRWYFCPTESGCGLDSARQFNVTIGIFLPSPEVSHVTSGKSSEAEFLFNLDGVLPFLSLLLLLLSLLVLLLLLRLLLMLLPSLMVVCSESKNVVVVFSCSPPVNMNLAVLLKGFT